MTEQPTSRTPWGLGRMAPYPSTIAGGELPTVIDPVSQLGCLTGPDGQLIEAKHRRSNTGTERKTSTNPGDGGPRSKPDTDQSQDSDQD